MNYLTRQELGAWLDKLAQEQTLIAPIDVAGNILYRPVANTREVVWEFSRSFMSVKEVFFPRTERLMLIEKIGPEIKLIETLPDEESIIFGVRPCDARGLIALDALFIEEEPVDPYYARRRENTTLIGLACQSLGPSCFCTNVGGAPDDPSGMDIMVTPSGTGFVVEIITEKGAKISKRFSVFDGLSEIRPHPTPAKKHAVKIAPKEAWPAKFNDDYWAEMAERCLSCRICAYVCPSCRCFDVRDEAIPGDNAQNQSERVRCWDSCNGIPYRRVAGGHNPRFMKNQRLRNRFYCKFHYFPLHYGPIACTGCGRCIDACPVNVDITEVLGYMAGGKP
jgi:sulfhydrogenase subunit beta (sulfur reductase)